MFLNFVFLFSVQFNPNTSVTGYEAPTISNGPFGDNTYVFQHLHMHWGSNDCQGSEHTLNFKRFEVF